MELKFHDNYKEYDDRDLVNKIITKPYNEEAAAYLIYNRYNPLLSKLYRDTFQKDTSWYEHCLGDLFEYLKGKNQEWNKLRTFQWRCKLGPWLGKTARNRFVEIKSALIGKENIIISIDVDDEGKAPVQLSDDDIEEYDIIQRRIILMEAIGKLTDLDQKFVVLKRLQGYNSREIAELMKKMWNKKGIVRIDKGKRVIPSAGYVDVRMQRAKEELKRLIVTLD